LGLNSNPKSLFIARLTLKGWRNIMKIPYCVPSWGLAEHYEIFRNFASGRLFDGEAVSKLINQIKEVTGKRYAFVYNSGREAIQAALVANGIGIGHKVIMPSFCCDTVAAAVEAVNATAVFCDINADLNPSVSDILERLDNNVKAIIYPHLFGHPGRIDLLEKSLEELGNRSSIMLIDDAAQSFGARLNGQLLGTFGDAGILSFGPGKTMTATGGGVLVTDSEYLAHRLAGIPKRHMPLWPKFMRVFYWVIFRRWRAFSGRFYPFFRFLFAYRTDPLSDPETMSNVDAAIALRQLERLEDMLQIRRQRGLQLDEMVSHCRPALFMESRDSNHEWRHFNVYTKYPLIIADLKMSAPIKKAYRRMILSKGIEIQPLYTPIHINRPQLASSVRLPITESLWDRILQIPLEPSISDRKFNKLLKCVAQFIQLIQDKHGS
jgi:perosamine synthetase